MRTYYDICQLAGIIKLPFHTEGIRLTTDIEVTARNILVFGSDNRADSFNAQVISFQFVRVAIYLNLTLRRTTDRHRSHTGNTCQRVNHTVVQYLVKRGLALIGLYRKQYNRNHVRTELEDDRILDIIRQL